VISPTQLASPFDAEAALAIQAEGMRSAGTISAGDDAVNWKIDKLTQDQAVKAGRDGLAGKFSRRSRSCAG
jgi:hypothetical protein